jgi:hypothetical protein
MVKRDHSPLRPEQILLNEPSSQPLLKRGVGINGTTEQRLIEQMREQLASQARPPSRNLAFAQHLPATLMAQLLGRPPRVVPDCAKRRLPDTVAFGLLSEYRAVTEGN